MALYAVYYQTGVSPLDGAPLCTIDLVTQVEATAIAKQQKLARWKYRLMKKEDVDVPEE